LRQVGHLTDEPMRRAWFSPVTTGVFMHRQIAVAAALVLFGCSAQEPSEQLEPIDLTIHQKPQLTIASPAPGSFITAAADGMVDVSGTATGASITVNGHAAAVDAQGNFHARIPAAQGLNVIDAHVSGLLGGESQRAFLYGTFADAGASIPAGVMVRATAAAFDDQSGDLDDFSAIARAMLAQVDIMQYVRQLPPFTWDLGPAHVDVAVTSVQFAQDKTALSLSPRKGGAHADGGLSALDISLQLTLSLDGLFKAQTGGTVSVDTVAFQADLDAAYQKGAIVASTETPRIQLGTLAVKTDLNFDTIDELLTFLANQFKDLIASTVAQQIQANAGNHFALALNQLGLPPSFDLSPYGLHATLTSTEAFDGASFDAQGATLSAATHFAWPAGAGTGPGSLLLGSGPATSFSDATFSVSVAMDALNQATFAVWGQNGLVRVVYPGKKYFGFKLDDLVAAPALPPVIAARDGKVVVSLGDIVVATTLHTFLADFPVQATLSGASDVALDIDPQNGALRMTATGTPTVWVDVNTLLGVVPDSLLAPLSSLLQSLAPTIVQKMVKPIEVPLPRFSLAKLVPGSTAKMGLTAPVVVTVDADAKRVNVAGDLAQY
jgi:murein DD-endopeptidase MepM/ murein hydrolase activator NlpD